MLVMMYFNFRIYRTATNTTKAIRQGFTKVKGSGGEGLASMGIHRGGGATAMALANSAASTMSVPGTASHRVSNAGTPRKGSASMRGALGAHSVASSRRTSATCLAVNGTGLGASAGLRRQQTVALEHASRTLPRTAVLSTTTTTSSSGRTSAANGRAGGGGGGDVRKRRGSGSEAYGNHLAPTLLLSPHDRRGSRGNCKALSSSTNSLHVPPSDYECRRLSHSNSTNSGLSGRRASGQGNIPKSSSRAPVRGEKVQNTPEEAKSLLSGQKSIAVPEKRQLNSNGGSNGNSKSSSTSKRPNMSHHTPCPNHIMGKTFAEQGTQTFKDERLLAATAALAAKQNGAGGRGRGRSKGKGKMVFRWRSAQASSSNGDGGTTSSGGAGGAASRRSESPCSMAQLAAKNGERRRRRLSLHTCFRFNRWRKHLATRGGNGRSNTRHSANSGSSGADSGPEGGGGGGTTTALSSGAPSAAVSHSDLSGVRLNHNDSHQNKFGKRNIKSQVRYSRLRGGAEKLISSHNCTSCR